MLTALDIYNTSDGSLTRAYYAELEKHGPIGELCVNLFRAQKASVRAKAYRGGIRGQGSYRGMAYDRKNWAMQNLCKVLLEHVKALKITWGWKEDPGQAYHNWVLYCDLPGIGQVSFHAASHGEGPLYRGDWDKAHLSAERILAFCDLVASAEVAILPEASLDLANGASAAAPGESSEPAGMSRVALDSRQGYDAAVDALCAGVETRPLKFGDPESIRRARG